MDLERVSQRVTGWWPEIVVALLVLVLALPTLILTPFYGLGAGDLIVVVLVGASAILFRRAPAVALTLVWAALLTHLVSITFGLGGNPQLAEIVVAVTAFGTARYGSRSVLIVSGLSIPAAFVLGIVASVVVGSGYSPFMTPPSPMWGFGIYTLGLPAMLILLLGLPWLVGLVLRSQATAADSEQAAVVAQSGEQQAVVQRQQAEVERGQAQEIAHLRADQARMAREVHDVVGHSLAVILAQAESAQFLPEASTAERRVLADVASTARQSLQDVRAVLGATRDGEPVPVQSTGGMDSLIDGVRSAGYEVDSAVVGIPRPLPPERDAVAFRVLQEMLTNALKHGSREAPIAAERHWDGDLRLEVRNYCADPATTRALGADVSEPAQSVSFDGTGVEGMRRRLESVGGRLDVRRRVMVDDSQRQTFTATAWLPLES